MMSFVLTTFLDIGLAITVIIGTTITLVIIVIKVVVIIVRKRLEWKRYQEPIPCKQKTQNSSEKPCKTCSNKCLLLLES